MIFVTVGTTKYPFQRLVKWSLSQASFYPDLEFIVQSGNYKLNIQVPKNVTLQPYFSFLETQEFIKKANRVVSHGGMATLMQSWSFSKKPLVLPRLHKLGEHANDHQKIMCEYLATQKKIELLNVKFEPYSALDKKIQYTFSSDLKNRKKLIEYLKQVC